MLLPHGGNSNTATRIALIKSVLPLLDGKKLSLLADREFIGQDWFQTLKRFRIAPCIRLKADTRVGGMEVWAFSTGQLDVDSVLNGIFAVWAFDRSLKRQ
ncbi:Mobile element protein [Deinococcus marmoris]|uniref:Mobile element protein n=1 Tax=Deinococcus marmoris TaxID=249408 RepID=A0A1U7NR00_9DEIO|nr:Mobile element protein [Deinococcus marmoris]